MAEKKPEIEYNKEEKKKALKRYEMAVTASALPEDPSYKSFAIPAMESFYKQFDMDKDPAVQRMFFDTQQALQSGQGYSAEMSSAINLYAGKYEKTVKETRVADFVEYTEFSDIPEGVKALITKYNDVEIGKLDKEKEEQKKVLSAIALLKQNTITGKKLTKLLSSSIEKQTKQGLESLL